MNEHNRYLWQFTAEEWMGPRIKNAHSDEQYAASVREAESIKVGQAERVQVDEVWAEHSAEGSLIFESQASTRVIGSLAVGGFSTIDPEFSGRGIATRVAVDGYTRSARVSPDLYLRTRAESYTLDGERYTVRLYEATVRRALELGLPVEPRVVESATNVARRFEVLRRGDDSALQLLSGKDRRRKERCGRVKSRYRWVTLSGSLVRWLSATRKPIEVRRFLSMVVVDDRF